MRWVLAPLALVFWSALPGTLHAREPSLQGGYSTQPLAGPVFTPEQVLVDMVAFNEWLLPRYASFTPELNGPREHLYALIASHAKALYAKQGVVFPRGEDAVLHDLFEWSERLGVYGGHLVYNRVKPAAFPAQPEQLEPPDGYSLELRGDLLRLASARDGWAVSVPYYFMIWRIGALEGAPQPTQRVVISTAAAAHRGPPPGHSQGTLIVYFGPGAQPLEFSRFWARAHGFSGGEDVAVLPVRELRARHRLDAAAGMHWEYVSWPSSAGVFTVVYGGLEGTYQANRPHFLDFLRAFEQP